MPDSAAGRRTVEDLDNFQAGSNRCVAAGNESFVWCRHRQEKRDRRRQSAVPAINVKRLMSGMRMAATQRDIGMYGMKMAACREGEQQPDHNARTEFEDSQTFRCAATVVQMG